MVEIFVAGQLASGHDDHLPAVGVVANDVDDSVSGDVREVVVVREGVVQGLLVLLPEGAAQLRLEVLLDRPIRHGRLEVVCGRREELREICGTRGNKVREMRSLQRERSLMLLVFSWLC